MKLPLKTHTHSPSGSYGSYIQLTAKKGIKIFDRGQFLTKEEAKAGHTYIDAKEEKEVYDYLHAKGCDFIPVCYNVAFIKIGEFWRVGLILQHLGNVRLYDYSREYDERYKVINEIEEKLNDLGVYHKDVHDQNIMHYEGRFWAIDFGKKYITYLQPS